MRKVTFGENLKNLREKAKLTQFDVALKLQISRQSISKWENDLSTPSIEMLVPLIKIINCKLDELFQINKNKI